MPLIVRQSNDPSDLPVFEAWLGVGHIKSAPDLPNKMADIAFKLEACFDSIREEWWELGRALASTPSGDLSHAASCAASPSDMGAMLAWAKLVQEIANQDKVYLAICDDPWLFRHLMMLENVAAANPPPLMGNVVRLNVRGWLARIKVAISSGLQCLRLKHQQNQIKPGYSHLMVYGHPASNARGHDAYFGNLMLEMPDLKRVLHTDCPASRALQLSSDGRTSSLHAWGNPFFAVKLLWARWRPETAQLTGPYEWLVRRAAILEGSGGASAMTRWQQHCHSRWLNAVKPVSVVWPWENHPWERDFVRKSKAAGVRVAGYLHTIVGRHSYNQSPQANVDLLASIPDLILTNGLAYGADLLAMGMPEDRLVLAGAFRFSPDVGVVYDPAAPIFVALSGNIVASRQLLKALSVAPKSGRQFLVKIHPMYPIEVMETENIKVTNIGLLDQEQLAGVLYSASVVGLEAVLANLPTLRFLTDSSVAIDVLPRSVQVPTVDESGLSAGLENLKQQNHVPWESIFSSIDLAVWQQCLASLAVPETMLNRTKI
jgi:hypothetical protein